MLMMVKNIEAEAHNGISAECIAVRFNDLIGFPYLMHFQRKS